jgi:hypothetical protein
MKTALSTGENGKNPCHQLCGQPARGVEGGRPSGASNTNPALTKLIVEGSIMATIPDTAQNLSAQDLTDPLILAARFINEAADLERRLAIRKALRPMRSDAAKRGWEARCDR